MFNSKKTILATCAAMTCLASQALTVETLRTQYQTNPVGIDKESPMFSWQLRSDQRSTVQKSYQVEIGLDRNMSGIVFDSGTVESASSVNVQLDGLQLQPSTRYYWRVTVTDNHGETAVSQPGAYFETGLLGSGWSGAQWIASGTGAPQTSEPGADVIKDYVIETDFEVDRAAAGLIWGATDRNNFYMWQISTKDGVPRFRPHVWNNGNPQCMAEIDLGIPLRNWETHHMRIEVTDGGTMARTYLDGILIDERKGVYPYGQVGMRSSNIDGRGHKPETAFYDYFKVTASDGRVLFDDTFDTNENFGIGEVANGQLHVSGPETLVFQNNFTPDASVKDYTFEGRFTIEQFCAGIAFAAKDAQNFYMWQFNIENGFPRFRPHRWANNNPACLAEIDLTGKVSLDAYTPHTFKIVVSDNGTRATTYLDGIEIDSRTGQFVYDKVGFRHSRSEQEWEIFERAYFDNLTVRDSEDNILFEEDFENVDDCSISGGTIVDGRLLVGADVETYPWAKSDSEGDTKLRYDIDADITLINDAASLIFSQTKSNCYFMWAINCNDRGYPLVRRHLYANSTNPQFSDTRMEGFTNEDILGVERHLRLEIDGSEVRTFIDDKLVDTYTDTSGLLVNGLIGFRVFHETVNEQAYWDNVKVTEYKGNTKRVTLSEDFEGDSYEFSSGEVVDVNGNRKLYSYSPAQETKIMQDAATASPLFRKQFTLNGNVKSAKLYTSALGVYNVYINGQRVGHEQNDGSMIFDELMPGWSDYRSTVFYLTHDVTSLLKAGENALGAVVSNGWWNGQVSHGIYGSSDVAFIGKLVVELENGEVVTLVTDQSWLTLRRSAIKGGEIYHGEIYDARLADGWSTPGYDVSAWNGVSLDRQSHGELIAHEGPTVKVIPSLERKPLSLTVYEGTKDNGTRYGEINTVATHAGDASVLLKKGQTMVVDFGQNASGWAKFKVKGASGAKVNLRFAEMINDSGDTERGNDAAKGALYTIALRSAKAAGQYILSGDPEGEIYRPTTTFYGFRYCDVTVSQDVEIEWITAETISTEAEMGSSLKVNDPAVNQLYSNIQWGQWSNFVSVPTDCPQRDERLGWTADTQVFSMAAMYNAQVQGFYHKWMRDMRDGQLDNGAYPNVAPFNWVEHGSSAWADAGIILPWNVYVMYGDKAIIEENYASMERYMDWLATQKEGQYQYVGSDTRYGDWLAFEDTDKRFVSVAYYGYMADLMSRMSKALSQTEGDEFDLKAAKYAQLFADIKSEFKTRYWASGRVSGLRQKSQCAMLLALRYDMLHDEAAVEDTRAKLRDKIEKNGNKLSTGFLGTAVLNQTLSQFGMDDLAYALLLQRECPSWLYPVDQGATTMWERWNSYTREGGFSKSIEMNSFNHYAYGAVGEWMYRYMAGIAPDYDAPGFSHIILKPSFDAGRRISDVDATFASNYGPIDAAWKTSDDGQYVYNVTVPANTTATLILPSSPDGAVVCENGKPASEAEGIADYADDGTSVTMTLGSGSYSFSGGITGGVEKVEADGNIRIYPNPATETVTVEGIEAVESMELRSLAGALVASVKGSCVLNVSSCAPALYLLTVKDADGKTHVMKLIKN